MDRKRVLVIGGNFAGLSAAKQLARAELEVTVIDSRRQFNWTPNIHEILSGVKQQDAVHLSRERLINSLGHQFVAATVIEIDCDEQWVLLDDGRKLAFDACLIACGHVSSRDEAFQGVHTHHGFRKPQDIEGINLSIQHRLTIQDSVNITLVGGGFSGIEGLGELLRRYRNDSRVTITLLERSHRLIKDLPEVIEEDILNLTENCAVEYCFEVSVTDIIDNQLQLSDGTTLESDVTIWTVGTQLPPFIRNSVLWADDPRGIAVTETLQHDSVPSVFVAGDAAALIPPQRKQSYNAIDMGTLAGQNITRWLGQEPMQAMHPIDKPVLLAFGDLNTYLVMGNSVLASPLLATMKEAVYQLYMAKFSASLPLFELGYGAVERYCSALSKLVLPELTHPRPLTLLRNSRVLQYGGSGDLIQFVKASQASLLAY